MDEIREQMNIDSADRPGVNARRETHLRLLRDALRWTARYNVANSSGKRREAGLARNQALRLLSQALALQPPDDTGALGAPEGDIKNKISAKIEVSAEFTSKPPVFSHRFR